MVKIFTVLLFTVLSLSWNIVKFVIGTAVCNNNSRYSDLKAAFVNNSEVLIKLVCMFYGMKMHTISTCVQLFP